MSEAAAAGEEGYGGGIGGKFRRRPFRRAPATPYDRPPAAARGTRGNAVEAAVGGRNGWLSKLVDPASRLITRGATKFFSSVFQKRLGAPSSTVAPASSHGPTQDVPDLFNTNPLLGIPERGSKDESDSRNNCKDDGISELEKLLKKTTFTRAEFDHLTELLRSRTVDSLEDAKKGTEPRIILPAGDYKKEKVEIISGQGNEIESSKFPQTIYTPAAALKIPGEEIASPAEVAKAYMCSRPPKVSLASSSLRNQTVREATSSPSFIGFAPKPSVEPVSSKSFNRLPAVPGCSENGYMPSKSRGRSAIYKMSRSPYFKGPSTITLKGSEVAEDGYSGPSTSNQWVPTNLALSGGKQVLKQRCSVLESDIGSFGPIRRIRLKSNLLPLPSQDPKYDTSHQKAAENGDKRSSYASVPPQSSEMARKILHQLDKLVPSPKEKSSVIKTVSRHESPAKLTVDMLHGQALKSVAEIDSSKVFSVENGKLEDPDYSRLGNSASPRQEKVKENGPSKPTTADFKMGSEAKGLDSVLVSFADTRPIKGSVGSIFPHSAGSSLQKKPGFTMQAPEALLELEDDNNNSGESGSSAAVKEKIEASAKEPNIFISETQVKKKPSPFSSECNLASNLTLSKEVGEGVTDRSAVADKDTGFTFQLASSQSQPPSTPTMPSPAVEKSAPFTEQVTAPIFTFSSKTTTPLTFSSSMTSFTEPSSGAKSDSKGQLIGSVTPATVTTPVESESGKTDTTQRPGDLFKSVGSMSSSGIMPSTTSSTSWFAASTNSSQSNGSLASTSSIFSVSAAPLPSLLGSSAGAIVSASSACTSASSGLSIASSASPAVTSLQFGTISAVSTGPVSSAMKSGSTSLGPEPVKESPFGVISSTAATTSSMGTSIFGSGVSASSSGSSTAGLIFGTQVTNAGSGTSPFTQNMNSQLSPTSSPAFGLAGSTFGFGSSAFGSLTSSTKPFASSSGFGQSYTTSSPADADSSSAPSSSSFAPSMTSPSLFGSSSQSTTSMFGSVLNSSSTSTMFSSATSSTASATTPFGSSLSSPLTFTSSAAATSSAFIFTQATTTSSPALSFTSFGTTTSSASLSPAAPAFEISTPTVGFASGSPGNDQMNIEDSMADDTVQSTIPSIPTFGQPSNVPGSNIPFGSPATPSGAPVFQFAGPQPSAFPQTPFQGTGSFEFGGGFSVGSGGFSVGSGVGDKPGRRFIKAKRDKHRKK